MTGVLDGRMMRVVAALMELETMGAVAVAVGVVTMVVLHLVGMKISSFGRGRGGLPPSPAGGLPVMGHLHLLRPPVHRTLHELALRVGPLMHVRLGSTHCVVASTAEVAAELIRGHEGKISERPVTAVARQFAYDSAGFAFAPYSPHWRFMKRLCMSELLGPRTVEQLRPVRRAGLLSLLQTIRRQSDLGLVVDLSRELIRMSNTSIIRMAASTVPASVTEEAQEVVKVVAELVGAFNADDYIALCRGWDLQGLGRRAARVHRRFDALLEEMIAHKEKQHQNGSSKSKDLLDILLDKQADSGSELPLSRENIKAFIMDVVTAGSDTSAAMVEWMVAELMNHPEALRKVREEMDDVVGRDRIVEETDLPRLPYLQAVYKETLRLRPAAPIAHRQSSEEIHDIRGFSVPANTSVFINVWAIARDPAYWDKPLEFRPERFLPGGGANEGLDPRGHHFHFMPFGSGRRGCPGMGLALQSVPAVAAALLQCFHLQSPSSPLEIDMDEGDGLVCARKHPLLLQPHPRLLPFPPLL